MTSAVLRIGVVLGGVGAWRAVDKALDGTPSFVRAEFWDREAWLMAANMGKPVPAPLLVIS